MDKGYCHTHEEFLVAVATLTADVRSMKNLFKWSMTTFVTLGVLLLSMLGTFAYKSGDLYSQVRVNSVEIATHKERLDAHGISNWPVQQQKDSRFSGNPD